jgi:rubrerythrin
MAVYSGAEIFQVAMQLEEAGRVFYETLAKASEDQRICDLCQTLAGQETDHYETFSRLAEELVQRPASRRLTWDEMSFAQLLIEERILSDPDVAEEAASSGNVAALLETAIQLEKDSVLLYSELLNEVYEEDAEAIQAIVDEEKRHVHALVKAKRNLSG